MYKALVILANDISPHPNADNLNLLHYNGSQFVISKKIQVGDTVVLFPSDGQLSDEFLRENNLYRIGSMNRDKTVTGFFEETRRVRTQPFRGEKSFGFVATPDLFSYLGKVKLSVGDEFDTLNGKAICSKYYTPKTLAAMSRNSQKKVKSVEYTMREHVETDKWSYRKPESLPEKTLVIITEKLHGSSARTSNTKVIRRARNIFEKIYNWFFGKSEISYELVSGTRRTIVNDREEITLPGGEDHYRWVWHNKIAPQLHKGETVYYEIVGYNSLGGTIMESQNLLKLKNFKPPKSWRNPMVFSYGLPEGENDVYVYRITRRGEDDSEVELSWSQVEQRCRELGLKTVPVLDIFITEKISSVEETLMYLVNDSSSCLDERHISEGVCIRFENSTGTKIYKHKNFVFGVLEDYLKEDADFVDTEEAN